MRRFLKDNDKLQLLHTAESMPLFDVFGDIVTGHAKHFSSVTCTSDISLQGHLTYSEAPKYTLVILTHQDISSLQQIYSKLHPQCQLSELPSTVQKFEYIFISGAKISSVSESATHLPYVIAKPMFPFLHTHENEPRPIKILHFLKHSFTIYSQATEKEERMSHLFAVVLWPQIHPKRHHFGKPYDVWCKDLYEKSLYLLKISFPGLLLQVMF